MVHPRETVPQERVVLPEAAQGAGDPQVVRSVRHAAHRREYRHAGVGVPRHEQRPLRLAAADQPAAHARVRARDGAQGFGGSIGNSKAGTFGHVSTTSFFPAKPLGGYGDGGAIFTNDNDLAEVMRSIRIHGYGNNKYDNVRIGVNGRLDTIQAAILLEKFEIFDEELKLRNEYSNYYIDNIDNNLSKPFIPKNYKSSWAQFSLLAKNTFSREKYMEQLKKHNIPSMIYYSKPLHLQLVYKNLGYKRGDFPISESVSDRVFSIPMHPYLTNEQQDMIIDSLNNE
mgnify:CR=1 FL=1